MMHALLFATATMLGGEPIPPPPPPAPVVRVVRPRRVRRTAGEGPCPDGTWQPKCGR